MCFKYCIAHHRFTYLQHISKTDPIFKIAQKHINPYRFSHGCKMPQVPGARYRPNSFPGPPVTRPGGFPNAWQHGVVYFQSTNAYFRKHRLAHLFNVYFKSCVCQHELPYVQHISKTDPIFKRFSKYVNPYGFSHWCKMPQVPGATYCPSSFPGPQITGPGGLPNFWGHGLAYFQYTIAYFWKHWLAYLFNVYFICCIFSIWICIFATCLPDRPCFQNIFKTFQSN